MYVFIIFYSVHESKTVVSKNKIRLHCVLHNVVITPLSDLSKCKQTRVIIDKSLAIHLNLAYMLH